MILVGDPDRVELVASLFDCVEFSSQHREFVCKIGFYKEKKIMVLSTGIGTDNIDIVINELDAIVNIDLKNRCDHKIFKSLDIVRIGTCGILQPSVPLHSYILSNYALGLDNVAYFYDIDFSEEELDLKSEIDNHMRNGKGIPKEINTYVSAASKELIERLSSDETTPAVTVTASGFYGPQGRHLRLNTKTTDMNTLLTSFQSDKDALSKPKIVNFEMESSALYAIGKHLGHRTATICLGIANRSLGVFSNAIDSTKHMLRMIEYVLDRI